MAEHLWPCYRCEKPGSGVAAIALRLLPDEAMSSGEVNLCTACARGVLAYLDERKGAEDMGRASELRDDIRRFDALTAAARREREAWLALPIAPSGEPHEAWVRAHRDLHEAVLALYPDDGPDEQSSP
jgi:hypothetical protein